MSQEAPDELLVHLFRRIPAPGSHWSLYERRLWIAALESAIDLVYGRSDMVELLEPLPESDEPLPETEEPGSAAPVIEVSGAPAEVVEKPVVEDVVVNELEKFTGQAVLYAGDSIRDGVIHRAPREEIPGNVSLGPGDPAHPAVLKTPVTKNGRPTTAPSNLTMALEAIDHHEGRASNTQIREFVRNKWWPTVPTNWSNCLWAFAGEKKLGRDGINFTRPDFKKTTPRPFAGAEAPRYPVGKKTTEVAVPSKPAAAPTPPKQQYRSETAVRFDHNEKSTELSARGYVMACKLKAAMGQHVAEAFLAERVIGSNSENNRLLARDICLSMNDSLAEVGLNIKHYPGFGLMMKEVE